MYMTDRVVMVTLEMQKVTDYLLSCLKCNN